MRITLGSDAKSKRPPQAQKMPLRFMLQRAAVTAVLAALLAAVAAGAVDFAWASTHGRWWPKIWLQSGGMALPWGAVGGALVGFLPRRATVIAVLVGSAQFAYLAAKAMHLGHPNGAAIVALRLAFAIAIIFAILAGARLQRALGWLAD